jgi:hypothetical protein
MATWLANDIPEPWPWWPSILAAMATYRPVVWQIDPASVPVA